MLGQTMLDQTVLDQMLGQTLLGQTTLDQTMQGKINAKPTAAGSTRRGLKPRF
jgi:hypothetical protein